MKVHDAIARFLDAENVDSIYTLMSEDIMGLTSTIRERASLDIDIVETRHEQWAVAMADGHARVTGEIGVCAIGRGPGIAQTGTALVTAQNKGSPILVIVPEEPVSAPNGVKYFEQESFLRSVVDDVVSVRDDNVLVTKFADAFRRLRGGEGPIAVQIPWNVMDGDTNLPEDWKRRISANKRVESGDPRLRPDDEQLASAVDLYLDSDATIPPLILVGQGAVQADAKAAIEDLAARTGGLLATTLQAKGYFDDHPFSVGFVGTFGTNLANEHLAQSDFVLAVGCSLNGHTTDHGRLLENSTVVHVDTNPVHIGAETPVDLGIAGDARLTVRKFTEQLVADGIDFADEFWTESRKRRIAETSPFDQREFEDTPGRIDPRDLIRTLDPLLPEDRLVVTDGGHFINWVLDGVTIDHPDNYIWTLDFGSIGVGVPIGMGAARAAQDRTTVLFAGDAGFMMTQQEVDTAVREAIPIIIIVMNDDALGSEYQQLRGRGMYTDAAIVRAPEFAALAEDFGAEGHTVRSVEDLEAIEGSLSQPPDGPVVVDCKIDRDVRHRFYDTVHSPS